MRRCSQTLTCGTGLDGLGVAGATIAGERHRPWHMTSPVGAPWVAMCTAISTRPLWPE